MSSGTVMALLSVGLMVLVVVLATVDDMLLPSQMMQQYKVGFPLIANGAIWGNLVILSAALYVIGAYSDQWSGKEILVILVLGMAISYALFHFVYLQGKFPDALAGGGRPISPAGWVTMLYSGAVIAAILLFYFRTNATYFDIVIVGILLAMYIPIANHLVLEWLNNLYYFVWCPDVFAEESTPLYFIIGGELLVVAGTVVKMLR